MSETYYITREIGIDAGHRVTHHGSKCRNIHGHRYTIHASCKGPLFNTGEQQGMVLDFGFLKELMVEEIDKPCDHGMILWRDDPILRNAVSNYIFGQIQSMVGYEGFASVKDFSDIFHKLYVVPFVPTAENLAKHWFERLAPRVIERSDGQAELHYIKVDETPNCSAIYYAPAPEGEENE